MLPEAKYNAFMWGLFLTMFVLLTGGCGPKVTVAQVNQLIAEELLVGSNKSSVIAFLDSHKIGHSDYIDYTENPRFREETSFQDHRLDGKRELIKGAIVAMMRDVGRKPLTDTDIQIHFYFDEKGTLVTYIAREINTSL